MKQFAVLAMAVALTGCASTTVQQSGNPLDEPLCDRGIPPVPVAIFWETHWRSNQKEPGLRSDLAERGIHRFVSETPGLEKATLQHLPLESVSATPADDELWKMTAKLPSKPRKLALIVVRELGPTLSIGLPYLIRGGTDVVLDVRILDIRTPGTAKQFQARWENGGVFVIKGVRTLSADMKSALDAALLQSADGKGNG